MWWTVFIACNPAKSHVRKVGVRAAALMGLLLLGGCATPGTYRTFREHVRLRPDEAALVEGVPALNVRRFPRETACLQSMVLYWGKSSGRSLARWQRKNAARYSLQEMPYRLGWEHGLFVVRGQGNADQLKMHLQNKTPVLVVLQRSALNPDTQREQLIVGYDDRDRMMLAVGESRGSYTLIPYDLFEREWRTAGNRITVLLPHDFVKRPPSALELFERARYHDAAGAFDAAVADYHAAAEAGLGQGVLYVRLGNTFRNMGKTEEAETAYRKAVAADPENGQAYNNLAYLLAENSKSLEEAARLARQAMILDPANPLVLDTLGFVLYQQGRYREAADVLERARGRARWHSREVQSEIAFRLVRAHLRNGDVHLAREVFRDTLRIAPAEQIPSDLHELLR